jgi:hypothetical protein
MINSPLSIWLGILMINLITLSGEAIAQQGWDVYPVSKVGQLRGLLGKTEPVYFSFLPNDPWGYADHLINYLMLLEIWK